MTTTTATDFYALLGVTPDATSAQIKSAYRKLAKQYHPDVNDSPDAAEKFREITEAYDTLTDPARRSLYDLLHGTGRTTFGDGERSRHTRPGNGTRTGNGSKDGSRNVSQAASPILKILEETWLEIRRWHPDIPPAVIIIASGTDSKNPRWGHHAPGRWNVNGQQYAEVMISGEGLRRTPEEVLGTLLHEAAHALAHARGIKDTSRQGPLPQQALQDPRRAARPGRRARPAQRLGRHHHHRCHQDRLRPTARRPGPGHDHVAARRDHHWPHGPAQLEPHRGSLPLRAFHPRRRLHPGRGSHHLPGLRRRFPGQEPGRRLSVSARLPDPRA